MLVTIVVDMSARLLILLLEHRRHRARTLHVLTLCLDQVRRRIVALAAGPNGRKTREQANEKRNAWRESCKNAHESSIAHGTGSRPDQFLL